jgi:hypothetical protein
MDAAIRRLVRDRAKDRCEYCQLPQYASEATFHIEHILAEQHAPQKVDAPSNLALACNRCNLNKGPNLSSLDPESGDIVRLFHPRRDSWREHFAFDGPRIVGTTPTGRATVQLLKLNAPHRVELRMLLRTAEGFDV